MDVPSPQHPPVAVACANQAVYFASIADCDWHEASVTSDGAVRLTAGAAVTVKVLVHVITGTQLLVYVQVTVALPPQAEGAVGVAGFLVSMPLQPPLAVTVANHAVNLASIADCDWHEASVTSLAQFNVPAVAVTLNV